MLVASELVASAVRHAGVGPDHARRPEGDGINVEVRRFDQHLHITVRDPADSQREDHGPSLAECAAEGLGRLIVEKLTCRWGSERQRSYVVWAELPLMLYAHSR
jgi:anti-sigma regulatory factor (Ser/Thr protein kinase)